MKIYIAGPMSGLQDFNYPAFHRAAAALRAKGYDVVNPAELFNGQTGHPWEFYMKAGLKALLDCTHIHLLSGYEKSRGARMELNLAQRLGYTISHEDGPRL